MRRAVVEIAALRVRGNLWKQFVILFDRIYVVMSRPNVVIFILLFYQIFNILLKF